MTAAGDSSRVPPPAAHAAELEEVEVLPGPPVAELRARFESLSGALPASGGSGSSGSGISTQKFALSSMPFKGTPPPAPAVPPLNLGLLARGSFGSSEQRVAISGISICRSSEQLEKGSVASMSTEGPPAMGSCGGDGQLAGVSAVSMSTEGRLASSSFNSEQSSVLSSMSLDIRGDDPRARTRSVDSQATTVAPLTARDEPSAPDGGCWKAGGGCWKDCGSPPKYMSLAALRAPMADPPADSKRQLGPPGRRASHAQPRSTPLLEGWLGKRSKTLHAWRLRWASLWHEGPGSEAMLAFSRQVEDYSRLTETFEVRWIRDAYAVSSSHYQRQHCLVFEYVTSSSVDSVSCRLVGLQMSSASERDRWLSTLLQAMEAIRAQAEAELDTTPQGPTRAQRWRASVRRSVEMEPPRSNSMPDMEMLEADGWSRCGKARASDALPGRHRRSSPAALFHGASMGRLISA